MFKNANYFTMHVCNLWTDPTHSEVMITEREPVLLEVAARGGGFRVFSEIILLVSGVDVVKECINMAMGYKVDISPKFSRAAVLRFSNLPQGRLMGDNRVEGGKGYRWSAQS